MKTGTPHDPSPEDRLEENDALWHLLAQAQRPEPDAWFTARTMARCRHEGLSTDGATTSAMVRVWRWVLGGGLAATMAVALMVNQVYTQKADPVTDQKSVQEAFEIMASIDTDSDSSSTSSWQDSSL